MCERFPQVPERLQGLGELAFNLWWSWNPEAQELFRSLDHELYRTTYHNPVLMLKKLSHAILDRAAADSSYCARHDRVMQDFRRYLANSEGWFVHRFGRPLAPIAYMSAEFGIHPSLPIYSGGLGILAGDTLKELSDLGVPAVGVGLLYSHQYVSQRLTADGRQEDRAQPVDVVHSALQEVMDEGGRPVRIQLPGFHPSLSVGVWRVHVGRVALYLLSTDVEENTSQDRGITNHLYTSNLEERMRQELVLGIGGICALHALGISPGAVHLNEGHPAFAVWERVRMAVQSGKSPGQALDDVRKRTVFTTHTPVPAGTDIFPFSLVRQHLTDYCRQGGLDMDELLSLGVNPADPDAGFNMTVFALRTSKHCNGVSRIHAQVAHRMWAAVRGSEPKEGNEIEAITNGVHLPTWVDAPRVQPLLCRYLGSDWRERQDCAELWAGVDSIPASELWTVHQELKEALLEEIRRRARQAWLRGEAPGDTLAALGTLLDPHTLTLGFARRFTGYKRADLVLHNRQRLQRLLTNPSRPVQIVFTGKAHPADEQGKHLLQTIFQAARDPECAGRIAFVGDYDQLLAEHLVAGVDVWLNNPLPPLEASGTSGMKASVNGVPNLSVLDGWWPEAFEGTNGWAIGIDSPEEDRDAADAESLYGLLEESVIPLYYTRGEDGVPQEFVRMMRAAMRTVAPQFSARRMVKEYSSRYYGPALREGL